MYFPPHAALPLFINTLNLNGKRGIGFLDLKSGMPSYAACVP